MTLINNIAGCYSMKRYIDQAIWKNDTPETRKSAAELLADIDRLMYWMSDLAKHKRAWPATVHTVLDDGRLLALVAGRGRIVLGETQSAYTLRMAAENYRQQYRKANQMTPEKQRLYDAFMAGVDMAFNAMGEGNTICRATWRGRFEEWLDEREKIDDGEAMTRQLEAHAEAMRKSHETYTAGGHE